MIRRDIIDAMLAGASTTAEIIRAVDAPDTSVRVELTRLQRQGLVRRVGHGKYELAVPLSDLMSDERHTAAVDLLMP